MSTSGNEFTIDDRFLITTDEDFAPYRAADFEITSGAHVGTYDSVIVPGGQAPAILPDLTLNGTVVDGGYGCPASAPVPSPADVPGYLDALEPGEETILVLSRGPVGDPSAPEEACFPGEKAHVAADAGWDAVVFVNHHAGDAAGGEPFCGSGAFVDSIVAVCVSHATFHRLFDLEPLDAPWTYPEDIAIGTTGADIEVGSLFDGWGYVHLFDAETLAELDTFAIDEAHDPDYALGYGDLSVHEVAVDPQDPSLAYLSYYSGGLRAIQIQCTDDSDTSTSTCELVEVGSYLDPEGNDFWGVETLIRDGDTYVLASDRDSGLWIFRDPRPVIPAWFGRALRDPPVHRHTTGRLTSLVGATTGQGRRRAPGATAASHPSLRSSRSTAPGANSGVRPQRSSPPMNDTFITTFGVAGMTCGHCVRSVKSAVGELDGVTGVSVEFKTGTVQVTSTAPLDTDEIVAAVDEAGYEYVG